MRGLTDKVCKGCGESGHYKLCERCELKRGVNAIVNQSAWVVGGVKGVGRDE